MMLFIDRLADTWSRWIFAASWQLLLLIALVAVLVALLRNASPRLRYGLLLLVLIKVFVPPSLCLPTGIGNWGLSQVIGNQKPYEYVFGDAAIQLEPGDSVAAPDGFRDRNDSGLTTGAQLMILWAMGACCFWAVVFFRYQALARLIRISPTVDEGPLRIALEKSGIALGIQSGPDLRVTDALTSPFLIGVIHPCVVLPERFVMNATATELSAVFMHELTHLKRRDTFVGWLQVFAQGLFWFHPFFWWANRQLRDLREEVCDETVLREGKIQPENYGAAMMRVLSSAKTYSLTEGILVGVFEQGTKVQTRLEKIMNYKPTKPQSSLIYIITFAIAALVLLPMSSGSSSNLGSQDAAPSDPQKTRHPKIVKTVPAIGATDVKAGPKALKVTFDRDMEKGMSWTGDPKQFPSADKKRKPRWIDSRTCVLPVKLERGKFYRLGINSQSMTNFRATDGTPVPPTAIYFVTEGAPPEIVALVNPPKIVKLEPANGANDVDSSIDTLTVTFNVPMGEDMSWTGGGPDFPTVPEGKSPSWSKDRLTCKLPVKLETGHKYRLGLNSISYNNFRSAAGIALPPVVYEFQTK